VAVQRQPSLWAPAETGIFLPKVSDSPLEAARLRPFLPEAFDSLLAVEPSVIRYGASASACVKGAQPGQALELLREIRRLCVEAAMCEAAVDEVAMDEAAMDEAATGEAAVGV
jgi:hypothetical protein